MKSSLIIPVLVILMSFTSAAINDSFHVNIQTVSDTGTIVTGTFDFRFDITQNSDCSGILWTNTTTKTTDTRGIVSYDLKNISIDFTNTQYYLCYYRDAVLKNTNQTAMVYVPYAYYAKNTTWAGVANKPTNLSQFTNDINNSINNSQFLRGLAPSNFYNTSSNINATGYNITANWFIGKINISNELNKTQFQEEEGNVFSISISWLINWIENNILNSLNAITGYFTNLFATNINATTINASVFYENGKRMALNESLNNYYLNSNPSNYINATISNGRLTLQTNIPITITDQLNKTILYFTSFDGNKISLYNNGWKLYSFNELSISLAPIFSGSNYDVFINSSLDLSLTAWANDNTRATNLNYQDGVLVKNGDPTMKYLGTIRASNNGQTEDSSSKRFVWNYYNRIDKPILIRETSSNWTNGTTSVVRQVNNNSANKAEVVVGWVEEPIELRAMLEGKLC